RLAVNTPGEKTARPGDRARLSLPEPATRSGAQEGELHDQRIGPGGVRGVVELGAVVERERGPGRGTAFGYVGRRRGDARVLAAAGQTTAPRRLSTARRRTRRADTVLLLDAGSVLRSARW